MMGREYFLVLLLVCVSTFAIGLFVVLKDFGYKKPVNRSFTLLTFSIAAWSGGVSLSLLIHSQSLSTLICRLYTIPVILIPIGYYEYITRLIQHPIPSAKKVLYGMGFMLLIFLPTNYLIFPSQPTQNFKLMLQAGPIYFLLNTFFISAVTFTFSILLNAYPRSGGQRKRHIQFAMIGSAVGFLGGFTNLWVPYRIWIYPINPYASLSIIFFVGLTATSIIKFQLMEIQILFRRASLMLLIYLFLLLIGISIVFLYHDNLSHFKSSSSLSLGVEVIFLGCLLSMGPFLYAYFVKQSSYFHENTLAGLTHELKSPLATIQSALEMIREIKPSVEDRVKNLEYLEIIERNSERLGQLINSLLQTYQHRVPKNFNLNGSIDLVSIIKKELDDRSSQARQKGLDLRLEAQDEKIRIKGDGEKIEMVISNLLSNAIKFSTSGTIYLRVRNNVDTAWIEVEDQGLGISKDDLPHIFDPFFQGKNKTVQKGSGLGLTLARTWIEAHGGRIWAESEGEGKGTKIGFTLPLASIPEAGHV